MFALTVLFGIGWAGSSAVRPVHADPPEPVRAALDECMRRVSIASSDAPFSVRIGPLRILAESSASSGSCRVLALSPDGQNATLTWGAARDQAAGWLHERRSSIARLGKTGTGYAYGTICLPGGDRVDIAVGPLPILQASEPFARVPANARPFFALVQRTPSASAGDGLCEASTNVP